MGVAGCLSEKNQKKWIGGPGGQPNEEDFRGSIFRGIANGNPEIDRIF